MSQYLLTRKFSVVLLLVLALGFVSVVPAHAASNQISDGRFCAGDNLTVAEGENIESLVSFGCNITIEQGASVQSDLAVFGGNVSIAGNIGGDIVSFGSNLALTETAVVNGQVNSFGGNLRRENGAVVNGGVNERSDFTPSPPINPVPPVPVAPPSPFSRSLDFGLGIIGGIVTALAFAALGALVVIFAPEPTRRIGNAVQAKPLNVAGVGCLTYIVLPILMLLLVITLVGIPVALILGLVALAAWVLGWIALGYLAGEKILQAFKAREILPVVAVILGVIILTLISHVFLIGWLVSFIGGLLGMGAIVLTRFGTRPYPAVPGMMMTPTMAGVGAGAGVPGTYSPSSVDMADWQDKARQAETRMTPPTPEVQAPPAAAPPTDTPPTNEGESKPLA